MSDKGEEEEERQERQKGPEEDACQFEEIRKRLVQGADQDLKWIIYDFGIDRPFGENLCHTPLTFACQFLNASMVERLLNAKADVEAGVHMTVPYPDLPFLPLYVLKEGMRIHKTPLVTCMLHRHSNEDSFENMRALQRHGATPTHGSVDVMMDLTHDGSDLSFRMLRCLFDEFEYDYMNLFRRLYANGRGDVIQRTLIAGGEQVKRCIKTQLTEKEAGRVLAMLGTQELRMEYGASL